MNFINKIAAIDTKQVVQGGRKKARAGVALLRLREYIELGLEAPKTEGWKPSRKVRMVFELCHPDHMITGTNEAGAYSFPDKLVVSVSVGGPTSRFGKLFAKLNYKGTAVHMSQLVGEGFLGFIHHNGDYVNLSNAEGEWTVGKPEHTDPMSNVTTQVNVPELDGEKKVFLFDHPQMDDADILEMWNAIYIDGEWPAQEAKDGKPAKPAQSKNWIQLALRESMTWDTCRTKTIVDAGVPAADAMGMDADLAALGLG
jgi:hypothetical protein